MDGLKNNPELEWVGWLSHQRPNTKSTVYGISQSPLAVDFKGVMQMFSCGRATAEVIARESGAEYRIGKKRYYIVARMNDYVCKLADEQNKH